MKIFALSRSGRREPDALYVDFLDRIALAAGIVTAASAEG